jgi:polyphosphate kinase
MNNQTYYNPADNINRNTTQRASCSPPIRHQAIENQIVQQLETNKNQ